MQVEREEQLEFAEHCFGLKFRQKEKNGQQTCIRKAVDASDVKR